MSWRMVCKGRDPPRIVGPLSLRIEHPRGWLDCNQRDGAAEWSRCREGMFTVTPHDKGVCHLPLRRAQATTATSWIRKAQVLASLRRMSQLPRRLRRVRALDNRRARGDSLDPGQECACQSLSALIAALQLRPCQAVCSVFHSSTEEDAV